MSALRRLSAACSGLLVACALVVAPTLTGPAAAAELLGDGGFESATGNPPNSPSWTEADSIDGSPLCTSSTCSATSSVSPPRSGNGWARFGASSSSSHTASLSQSVVIPVGTATLTYWYRNGQVTSPFTATLRVQVDGTTLKTHTEASSAQSSYSQQTVSLSAYANGQSHTIRFLYANNATGENRMTIDDVSLNHTPPTTATPTVTSTTPASPSDSTTPLVKGTAESGSTVTLYSNNSCSSAALGSGTAAAFAGSGITATVPANATTTIYARATKSGQNQSACSSTSVSYTHDSNPPGLPTLTSVTPTSPGTSTTPVIKGTAEAGSTVRLYPTSDCTGSAAATGTAAAFASSGLSVTVAAGSTTTFRATATDVVGNVSGCSTSSLTYTQDSTAPGTVSLTSVTPTSPGASTSPVIKGTAEAGSTVRLYPTVSCTGSPAATGTAAAFASPGLTVTVAANSTTTFRATATDPAGNVSACSTSSLTYVNDSSAPGQVSVTSVTPASPNTSTTPVVKGTAEAGSTVKLYGTAGCTGSPVATGTASAFASPGLTATVVLGTTTTFRATATDAAGNTSACSSSSVTYTSNLADGGFEAATGDPPNSPSWVEADSLAWPLCTVATCTPGPEIAPHGGNAWAWFGGLPNSGHTGSVSQAVTLPNGGPVGLGFWYRNSTVTAPYDARLLVQVDGTTVRTITESTADEAAYSRQVVDISAFADGGSHTITFSYINGGEGVTNMLVDDVSLGVATAARVATPIVGATAPVSPSTNRTPLVTGLAETGSTVVLYATSNCTGAPMGSGSAADFASPGIAATVPFGGTTLIFAQATKAGEDDSACSANAASYTHRGPPETTLVKTPKKKVLTKKGKDKVVFVFSSSAAGATFECSIDGKAFKACTSGQKVKLKVGKHTFAVRALAYGLTDLTPATYAFKIKRRH